MAVLPPINIALNAPESFALMAYQLEACYFLAARSLKWWARRSSFEAAAGCLNLLFQGEDILQQGIDPASTLSELLENRDKTLFEGRDTLCSKVSPVKGLAKRLWYFWLLRQRHFLPSPLVEFTPAARSTAIWGCATIDKCKRVLSTVFAICKSPSLKLETARPPGRLQDPEGHQRHKICWQIQVEHRSQSYPKVSSSHSASSYSETFR